MKELIDIIRPQINQIINKYKIDGVGFIPPTVKREVQFMKILEVNLNLPVKILKISKIKTDIVVPQKTLNKLDDRINNAKRTIVVEDYLQYNNVLLIDDAVGSGATLNETAFQIKKNGIAKNIIGLAITGSFKGFDVISEV
jgi:phosphoribosylpyrophosphate synthetase